MGSNHKHDSDNHKDAVACCVPSFGSPSWCACLACVVLVVLFACVPQVAAQDRAIPVKYASFINDAVAIMDAGRHGRVKRAVSGAEVDAILVVYDEDGDGFLSDHEFEEYYFSLIPEPVVHIAEELAENATEWSARMMAVTNGSADFFVDEGAALCLNETALFSVYDSDLDGFLNSSEIAPAATHLTLIAAYCEPEHTELPLCTHKPGESWGYGLLATFIIALMSLLGVVFLPFNFKAAKLPLMQFLLALAVGALVGDSLLHIVPTIFGAHGHHEESEAPAVAHAHDAHGHEEEGHTEEMEAEERLEALRTYLGPALIICLTILVLFLVEKLIMKLAGGHGHGHSHGGDDEEEETPNPDRKKSKIPRAKDGHGHRHKENGGKGKKEEEGDEEMGSTKAKSVSKETAATSSSKSSSTVSKGDSDSDSNSNSNSKSSPNPKENSSSSSSAKSEAPKSDKEEGDKVIDLEADSKSQSEDAPKKVKPLGWFFIIADLLHNCVDGLLLGFAFSAGPQNGLVAAIAVLLHEIPKELGTYALLIQAGFTRKRALLVNFAASVALFAGAIIGLSVGSIDEAGIRWVLSIVVGAFLYLAVADIIPQLQSVPRTPLIVSLQTIGILVGFVALFLIALFEDHGEATCRKE